LSADALLLDGEAEDYEFLNKSKREVDGIDDVEEWHSLKVCLSPFSSPHFPN
jgi:myosin protein heavy chain